MLYQQFVAARAHEDLQREMKRVRAGGTFEPERVQSMLNGPATEQDKANMRFGLDWFTSMAKEDRVKLLSTHGLRQPKFRIFGHGLVSFQVGVQGVDAYLQNRGLSWRSLKILTGSRSGWMKASSQKVVLFTPSVNHPCHCA